MNHLRRLLLAMLAVILSLPIAVAVRGADPPPTAEQGTASWFGSGNGVATQWCTWTLRHAAGCGFLAIQSQQTGITVIAPVIDWCQCYRDTSDERIVDLNPGVVKALGLKLTQGLYPVIIWRVESEQPLVLPDTAMNPVSLDRLVHGVLTLVGLYSCLMMGLLIGIGRPKT